MRLYTDIVNQKVQSLFESLILSYYVHTKDIPIMKYNKHKSKGMD
jgi:hypothetical protein